MASLTFGLNLKKKLWYNCQSNNYSIQIVRFGRNETNQRRVTPTKSQLMKFLINMQIYKLCPQSFMKFFCMVSEKLTRVAVVFLAKILNSKGHNIGDSFLGFCNCWLHLVLYFYKQMMAQFLWMTKNNPSEHKYYVV